MVGGLVEQQQVGLLGEGVGERGLLAFAAGHGFVDFEKVKKLLELVWLDAGLVRDRWLLVDAHNPQAVGLLQLAVVERHRAGEDAKEGGLAGAVPADEADALAGLHRERGAVEEREVA